MQVPPERVQLIDKSLFGRIVLKRCAYRSCMDWQRRIEGLVFHRRYRYTDQLDSCRRTRRPCWCRLLAKQETSLNFPHNKSVLKIKKHLFTSIKAWFAGTIVDHLVAHGPSESSDTVALERAHQIRTADGSGGVARI